MNKRDFTILRGNLLATLRSLPSKMSTIKETHGEVSVVQAKAIVNVVSPITDKESDVEEGTSSEEENPVPKKSKTAALTCYIFEN